MIWDWLAWLYDRLILRGGIAEIEGRPARRKKHDQV